VIIGVSLKMYFGYRQTLDWCDRIAEIARRHQAVRLGSVTLVVLPSFPAIAPVLDLVSGTGVQVGAQNMYPADNGPYTGEVSGSFLAEMGCAYVEVGHAERRRLFGEDADVTAAKTVAALQVGLTPILCLGEEHPMSGEKAASVCTEELDRISAAAAAEGVGGAVVVAYEPQWAIGAREPASTDHIVTVCSAIADRLRSDPVYAGSQVIYGGSAGPGLLTHLGASVDGLFLGRFAHDPAAVEAVLDEIHAD
jgi:triosephosphate isomerase